jgi:signal transduction histidine kinase
MPGFLNHEYKPLMLISATILLGFILLGQLLIWQMTNEFKQTLVAHDREVAGYLARNDLSQSNLALAFTNNKTSEDLNAGQVLLQFAGYDESTQNNLIPLVQRFHLQNALLMLIWSTLVSALLLAAFALINRTHDRRIEHAITQTHIFLAGNTTVRLEDRGDGSLPRLFATINSMATTLTAYVDKERHSKEVLRDAIADISHQLKTPLAALRMYNEIIQNEHTYNPVVDGFNAKSAREVDRMEILIQNLLKLTKLDTGLIALQTHPHNLKQFLEDCAEEFQTRAEQERKSINVDCGEKITLSLDNVWLLEAVSNLIKNALDHTNRGDSIEVLANETPVVTTITIRDSGCGIHPEDIHHIFKRFYRSRFSKDQQGIGIGLTLSKAIVEQHGGSLVVESVLGMGSAFQIIFPKLSNM